MSLNATLSAIGLLLAGMVLLALIEALFPSRPRQGRGLPHLFPNLALTLITVGTGAALNIPMVLALVWAQAHGWGLLRMVALPPAVALFGGVLVLDLAWYVTHRTLHLVPALWRFHAVHHADPMVDVTTALRQHPGEGVVRYAFLVAFGLAFGVSPAAFVAYRVWSGLHGQLEHANVRLPGWMDGALSLLFSTPNMHKVHHARDPRYTDRNFTNIFSVWDRLGGTFTPGWHGLAVVYGLEGEDQRGRLSTAGLLAGPFAAAGRPAEPVTLAAEEIV